MLLVVFILAVRLVAGPGRAQAEASRGTRAAPVPAAPAGTRPSPPDVPVPADQATAVTPPYGGKHTHSPSPAGEGYA
jgi:hypothetical protein